MRFTSLCPFSLLIALILGCATPSAPSAPAAGHFVQDAAPDVDHGFTPIRFGDDDEHAYDVPFFPGATYDPAITTPATLLGQPLGSRLVRHAELVAAFRVWGQQSARADVAVHSRTYEGRELLRVVITSEANHARMAEIQKNARKLWDPRGLSDAEARRIVDSAPAIAWLGYSIHGDETSGADASLAVAYHLIAGTDANVTAMLDDLVIVMDPMMNPDGRMRILNMVEQSAGYRTSLNNSSMHRGRWPFGRGNHYLFDMNRDWMVGSAPETRGRWQVALEYPPQLFVDGHEMSGLDTFLFYPQADPHLPQLPQRLDHWQGILADDAGRAFDKFGWGYYTREWADAWCPFYSDAWGSLNGAIGMLYEQGGQRGMPLMRESGAVVSYRESVHGQVVASMSNLTSLQANQTEILGDYLAARRRNVDAGREGGERVFAFTPKGNATRESALLRSLLAQGIEVYRSTQATEGADVVRSLGGESSTFAQGTYFIPAAQPQGAMVQAYFDFDPRFSSSSLQTERESLERKGSSKVYDVTAWDLGRMYDLDAAWCQASVDGMERVTAAARPVGAQMNTIDTPYAWIVDASDDASVRFAARAMELGLQVHVSDKAFRAKIAEGAVLEFSRGSFLLRRHENPADVDDTVVRAARDAGAMVFGTVSGRSMDAGPDLGGGHFTLLREPRVALVGNTPFSGGDYGHLWQWLDEELRLPITLLDAQSFGRYDLRRYNVIILPPGSPSELGLEGLRSWVRGGGTLIACGRSAAALTGEGGLSSVVRRRDALDKLDEYAFATRRAEAALDVTIDEADLWGDEAEGAEATGSVVAEAEEAEAEGDEGDEGDPDAERHDRWSRRFAPAGVILRGRVNPDAWITAGFGAEMPVFSRGSNVFLAGDSVQTAVRLADSESLRLGGLLWPEARERLAESAWLTVESAGRGQVILFAASPCFRGSFRGGARLFSNAVVLGPGAGASQPLGW
jgi:hypothetical protein